MSLKVKRALGTGIIYAMSAHVAREIGLSGILVQFGVVFGAAYLAVYLAKSTPDPDKVVKVVDGRIHYG